MDTPRPQLLDFQFHQNNDSFTLHFQQRLILTHSKDNPCLWIGSGIADIDMFRGNFSIKDKLQEKIALTDAIVSQSPDGWLIHFSRGSDISATLNISADDQGRLLLELQNDNLNHNRIWLRLAAQPEDHIYGCGEQFSYFDLRGKPFPLWTSEQGVGRNKQTYVTWQADCKENAGGDYYWTFFPQPTFVSTQKYYCHVDNSCYMNFDFSAPEYHELALWEDKATLRFECADTYISLLEKLTALLGRQPELPDWIYDGVTLGIQGGTEVCQKKLDTMRNAGVKVNGIWAQDWSGIRMTSFGKRVMWNWKWNSENYPQLDSRIKQWNQEGVQFLALFEDDLYFKMGRQANQMAARLQKGLKAKGWQLWVESPTNQVFVIAPNDKKPLLDEVCQYEDWCPYDADHTVVRFVCCFHTTEADVDGLLSALPDLK